MKNIYAKIKINNPQKVMFFFIALALAMTLFLNGQRIYNEFNNRSVELAIDFEDITTLSALTGVPLNQLLSRVSKAGITSLAVVEDNLSNLERSGRAVVYTGFEVIDAIQVNQYNQAIQTIMNGTSIDPRNVYVVINDSLLLDRAKVAFFREIGEGNVKVLGNNILELRGDEQELSRIGLGYSSGDLKTLNNYGFAIIPRIGNSGRLNAEEIALKLNSINDTTKFYTIIFDKESVLGYPRDLSVVAQKLDRYELGFGLIEFGKQRGDYALAKLVPQRTVRVHSIQAREMLDSSLGEVLSRFVRAVEERGMRLLYIRPFLSYEADEDLLNYNVNYFQKIKERLEARGYSIAVIKNTQLKMAPPALWQICIIILGILMALILLISWLLPLTKTRLSALITGAFLAAMASSLIPYWLLVKLYALLTASVFPALLILLVFKNFEEFKKPVSRFKLVLNKTSLVLGGSILIGLVIAALLGSTVFMLGIMVFPGVKLAFVLPLFLIWFYLSFLAGQSRGFVYKLKRILASQINISLLLLFGIGAVVLFLMVVRSGNTPAVMVSESESRLREILERILFVRPRFKEFFIGWPALVLLCWFAGRYLNKRWAELFIIAGAIASISVVNSFCHLHTPILYSILRGLIGYVAGIALGLALVWLLELVIKLTKRLYD
ncbi:MAG: DUF5693 family protein [Candidatus Margulisiibacteriota bacterium]|jgi:hypothetical protein